jgi:hypothetical protein
MDVGGTSLFLDRYNRERMVNGLGVVGGVHSLHEIFGVSGTAPGSMADGTYDAGKGNAGILRSLVRYSRSLLIKHYFTYSIHLSSCRGSVPNRGSV